MKKLYKRMNQKGFTLIELMIVVGIIGILVAIAAPNFSRYQSKARQSEAKIALAAVYGAEKAFYSEYAAYISSFEAIGYTPEGQRRFYDVGWAAGTPGAVASYSGGTGNQSWSAVNNSFGGCSSSSALTAALTGADPQTFLVSAHGCIRQAAQEDKWTINDTKVLSNSMIGL